MHTYVTKSFCNHYVTKLPETTYTHPCKLTTHLFPWQISAKQTSLSCARQSEHMLVILDTFTPYTPLADALQILPSKLNLNFI